MTMRKKKQTGYLNLFDEEGKEEGKRKRRRWRRGRREEEVVVVDEDEGKEMRSNRLSCFSINQSRPFDLAWDRWIKYWSKKMLCKRGILYPVFQFGFSLSALDIFVD